MDIADIRIALYPHHPPSRDLPSPKTPTCSDMRSHRGTRSAAAPLTLLLIPGMPSTTSSATAAPASTENIRVYLAIAVSAHIDIVYKQVTEIAKDVWAMDC